MNLISDFTFNLKENKRKAIKQCFIENGVVLIKNFFPKSDLDYFINESETFFSQPMLNGNFGYLKVDYPKKFVDPFHMSLNSKKFCLNEDLIKLVEYLMDSKTILSEATLKLDKPTRYEYFGAHNDYVEGTRRSLRSDKVVTKKMINNVLAIGGVLYLHDCTEGSFYYILKSHKFKANFGQSLNNYPQEIIEKFMASKIKLDGKRGDLILFDDRGFHGPSQPSSKIRKVLLLDWLSEKVWNGKYQMRPLTILSNEIDRLSPSQLRVIGSGARTFENLSDYHFYSKFKKKKRKTFFIIEKIIEYSFFWDHLKQNLRNFFRK